jgi:hypothetical protein
MQKGVVLPIHLLDRERAPTLIWSGDAGRRGDRQSSS